MKKLFILLLLIPIISIAQTKRREAKDAARQQITELKNGVLLVRLSQRENVINAIKKTGRNDLAEKTAAKNELRNQLIVSNLKSNFDFCPVYFFYSEYSKYIINNQLDSIVFLNEKLQPDLSININNATTFYTAEFGITEPDNVEYSKSEYYDYGKKQNTYYTGSGITLTGLIIKNNKFEQLKKPFPYLVREFRGLVLQRGIKVMVIKMNAKLHGFYK